MAITLTDQIQFSNITVPFKNMGGVIGKSNYKDISGQSIDDEYSGEIQKPSPLINAIDIDWNSARINSETVINSTGDLLKFIQNINSNTLFQPETSTPYQVTFNGEDTANFNETDYIFTNSISLSELTAVMLNKQIVIASIGNIGNPPFYTRKYCLLNAETSEPISFIDTPETTDQNAVLLDVPNGYSNIKIGISFTGGAQAISGKSTWININSPKMYITQNPINNQELNNTSVAHSFIVPEILAIKEQLKQHTSVSIDKTFTDGTHVTDMDGLLEYIDSLAVMLLGLYSQITVNTGE